MADTEKINTWEDITIQPQDNLGNEDTNIENWEQWSDRDQKAIKNLIEKYKTPEELAKAKRETDKKMSEIIAEKKVLEKILKDEKTKSLKKWNKTDLLEAYSDDPELADEVSKELFWKNVVELVEDYNDYDIIENQDDWRQFIAMTDVDKIVEMKMKKILASQKKEELENTKTKKKEEKINSFIEEKWVDAEDFAKYVEEYEMLWDIDKVLKTAYAAYFSDNYEDNDKISRMKEKAASNMTWNSKKSNWNNLSYTDEDLVIAKYAKMSIEKYMAFKNEQAKKWNPLYL